MKYRTIVNNYLMIRWNNESALHAHHIDSALEHFVNHSARIQKQTISSKTGRIYED